MALSASAVSNIMSGATAGNVNGGYFNTANANFVTDYTATSATGSTPEISSATISFVAGDVDAYIYVKAGTDWTPGFYKITSVASGKATIDASIGSSMQFDSVANRYAPSTVAGCATTASPTGGTLGVSYIHQNAAEIVPTDLASVGSSVTVTSASAPFRQTFVGNHLMISTTGTGGFGVLGWYEIVLFNSTSSIDTDRTTNSGTAMASVTGSVGGAISLGSSTASRTDDHWFETSIAGMHHFIKNGTFTTTAAMSVAASGTIAAPIMLTGYDVVWGDNPQGTSRPQIVGGANTVAWTGSYWVFRNIRYTGTVAAGFTPGPQGYAENCQAINTSTTAGRAALTTGTSTRVSDTECISYRGMGIAYAAGGAIVQGCVCRCSNIGIQMTSVGNQTVMIYDNIIANNVTYAVYFASAYNANSNVSGNTIIGPSDKLGKGIELVTGNTGMYFKNNIIANFVTGINHADTVKQPGLSYNDYYNNTTDVSGMTKNRTAVAVDPAFVSYSQVLFATATTSGSVVTQSGATFVTNGVVAGRDYLHLRSGTGVTVGFYGITAVTETTLTLDIAPGTSAVADKTGSIMTGWNLLPTGAI